LLGDAGRLHLQHGPIDLIIGADAAHARDRQRAFAAAAHRFDTILSELVDELPLLRRTMTLGAALPRGRVARRMDRAVRPLAQHRFITRMAAVAGAVADEVLAAMTASAPLSRAYVNNGGDIALHLAPGTSYRAAIAGLDGTTPGRITVAAASRIRGIATSGQGGRSLSLGIADSVTVLAQNAAGADAAATLIANAVDLPGHAMITRTPACEIDPDSDLGTRRVVTHVGPLTPGDIDAALNAGAACVQLMLDAGLVAGAALFLRGQQRIVGGVGQTLIAQPRTVEHA